MKAHVCFGRKWAPRNRLIMALPIAAIGIAEMLAMAPRRTQRAGTYVGFWRTLQIILMKGPTHSPATGLHVYRLVGNAKVGCGFITWSFAKQPELLDLVLELSPAAIMFSFGAPGPFAARIHATGTPLICQLQTMAHARAAVDAGAAIIVAQGAEAGGHGLLRATLTLVPEVADMLAAVSPDTLLLAAGGIADGRGLAASLMLGADGVLIGSRFWATAEALVNPAFQNAAIAAEGDATIRTSVPDRLRKIDWPEFVSARVMRNRIINDWHGREAQLADDAIIEREGARYFAAVQTGDADNTGVWVGEAAGMIRDVQRAGDVVQRIVREAERLLAVKAPGFVKAGR